MPQLPVMSASQPPRRTSTNPGRRKKSKCPGEKPQCSICSRLGQSCLYEAQESEARKRKRSPDRSHDVLPGGEVRSRTVSLGISY